MPVPPHCSPKDQQSLGLHPAALGVTQIWLCQGGIRLLPVSSVGILRRSLFGLALLFIEWEEVTQGKSE